MPELLPPLEHVHRACLNCPEKPVKMNLNGYYHPGFGGQSIIKDGETVISDFREDHPRIGRTAEKMAREDPEHDWRIKIDGPMYGVVYQRHGFRKWYAVERLDGFA